MAVKFEGRHPSEFVVWEARANESRSNKVLVSGQNLKGGTLLEYEYGSTSRVTAWTGTRDTGGSPDPLPMGVLISNTDASRGDVACAVITGDAELNFNLLTYPAQDRDEVSAGLALLGITARGYVAEPIAPVFEANFVTGQYTGGAALSSFLMDFYDQEAALSEFLVDSNGLHPAEVNGSLSAKGALLAAMADSAGFTIVYYFKLADVTQDRCLFNVYRDAAGASGPHMRGWVQSSQAHAQQRGEPVTLTTIDTGTVVNNTATRLGFTFTPSLTAISVNGAAAVTAGGFSRNSVDRADIGNRDGSALFDAFSADYVLGFAVYAPQTAAVLRTLNPMAF